MRWYCSTGTTFPIGHAWVAQALVVGFPADVLRARTRHDAEHTAAVVEDAGCGAVPANPGDVGIRVGRIHGRR